MRLNDVIGHKTSWAKNLADKCCMVDATDESGFRGLGHGKKRKIFKWLFLGAIIFAYLEAPEMWIFSKF